MPSSLAVAKEVDSGSKIPDFLASSNHSPNISIGSRSVVGSGRPLVIPRPRVMTKLSLDLMDMVSNVGLAGPQENC